jgi:phosphatidylglycerophosphate synthase
VNPRVSIFTLPNLLSLVRLAAVPVLLALAYAGVLYWFLAVLALAFFSDALDGLLARRLGLESSLGATLDSCGDVGIYASIPLAAWWLWPDVVKEEWPFFLAVIMSYTVPALAGIIKYGAFTSYHTVAVKFAALVMAPSILTLLAGGPVWPFQWATPICVLAGLEETLITLALPKQQSNVRSLLHILRSRHGRA